LRSGFFSFQAATSASTMPALPPERSHITRSSAAAMVGTAASRAAAATALNASLFRFIGLPPSCDASAPTLAGSSWPDREKLFAFLAPNRTVDEVAMREKLFADSHDMNDFLPQGALTRR